MQLSPLESLALSKFKPEDGSRESVAPGKYAGSFLVRVQFGVNVGEDKEVEPTASVPWQALAVLALSKLNDETADSVIKAALDGEATEDMTKAQEKRVKPRVEAMVASLPKIKRSGSVRATVVAEKVAEPIGNPHNITATIGQVTGA